MDPKNTSRPSQNSSYEQLIDIRKRSLKHPKLKKLTIILACLAFIMYIKINTNYYGSIGGAFNSLIPMSNPEGSHITTKRNAAIQTAIQSFEDLERSVKYTKYETDTHDKCSKGQNNAKVHDGFKQECSYKMTNYYGFNGDFRNEMLDLDRKIINSGWSDYTSLAGSGMNHMLVKYYDVYYGSKDPSLYSSPDGYLVSNLPDVAYHKDEARMTLDFAEKATQNPLRLELNQAALGHSIYTTYEKKNFHDMSDILTKVTADNSFLIAVSIQVDYYQK